MGVKFNYDKFRKVEGRCAFSVDLPNGGVAAAATVPADGFQRLVRFTTETSDWIHTEYALDK